MGVHLIFNHRKRMRVWRLIPQGSATFLMLRYFRLDLMQIMHF